MNDDRALRDLEQRCARTLHAAAPVPPPDFAARCLERTAVEPQRRGLGFGLLRIGPPLAAVAAVVVLAAVVGLQLGNLIPDRGPGAVPTLSPSGPPSPEPSTPEPSSPVPTPDLTPSPVPSPSASAAFPGGAADCTNAIDEYAVSYPADWYTNAEIDLDEFDDGPPTGACTFFGRQPMDLRPNAGLPETVVIRFAVHESPPPPSDGAEIVSQDAVTVAGRPAVVTETEHMTDAGAPFSAPGDRTYTYAIELAGGGFLVVETTSRADGDFDENTAVLDAMMSTLRLTDG